MKAVVESYESFWYSQFHCEMESALGELEERIKVYEVYDEILVALDPGGNFNTVATAKEELKSWKENLREKTWPKMIAQCAKGGGGVFVRPRCCKTASLAQYSRGCRLQVRGPLHVGRTCQGHAIHPGVVEYVV